MSSDAVVDRLKQVEAREKALAAKEQAMKAQEAELDIKLKQLQAAEDEAEGRTLRPAEKAIKGPCPYRFNVGPRNEKYADRIPTIEIEAVDESEAIRVYILRTADPDKPNKQIDPLTYELKAICLNPEKRLETLKVKRRLVLIREKFNRGQPLAEDEMKLLEEADYS
jgi:hypothetical protein